MAIYKTVSWDLFNTLIAKIEKYLKDRSFKPDLIVGIARGGLTPAVTFSHHLNVRPMGVIAIDKTKSDQSFAISGEKNETFYGSIFPVKPSKPKKILIVDDIVAYGDTMKCAREIISNTFTGAEVCCVSLAFNSERFKETGLGKNEVLDFYSFETNKNTWVLFPWEKQRKE